MYHRGPACVVAGPAVVRPLYPLWAAHSERPGTVTTDYHLATGRFIRDVKMAQDVERYDSLARKEMAQSNATVSCSKSCSRVRTRQSVRSVEEGAVVCGGERGASTNPRQGYCDTGGASLEGWGEGVLLTSSSG